MGLGTSCKGKATSGINYYVKGATILMYAHVYEPRGFADFIVMITCGAVSHAHETQAGFGFE